MTGGRAAAMLAAGLAATLDAARPLPSEEAPVWFKHPGWIPVAWLLSALNLGAVWFAARPAEPWHATVHALLAVGFALGAQWLTARRQAAGLNEAWRPTIAQGEDAEPPIESVQARVQELEERLDFAERLLAESRESARRDAPPR